MHLNEETSSRLSLISAMVIWGSIGIFRKFIPVSSSLIALIRGAGGMLFLLLAAQLTGRRLSLPSVRKNALLLLLSGAFIGFNWILLFESYRYASVATATLCYYMAPVIVTLASPFLLHERLTTKKLFCIAVALTGMLLISGGTDSETINGTELRGIILGLAAAVLYAGVILTNKKISSISASNRTVIQLGAASLVLLPYTLLTGEMIGASFTPVSLILLLIVSIVHTGVAYALYFGSMDRLNAQTVALYSYIDPVVAILLSTLLLGEGLSPAGMIGAFLILGATLASKLLPKE